MGNQTKFYHTNFGKQAQQFNKSKVQCYKCNKYGHYQNECNNELQPIPQQMILHHNVNIIRQKDYQWTEDNYYRDDYWKLSDLEDVEEDEGEYKEPQYYGRQVNPMIRQNQLSPPHKPMYNLKNHQS